MTERASGRRYRSINASASQTPFFLKKVVHERAKSPIRLLVEDDAGRSDAGFGRKRQ